MVRQGQVRVQLTGQIGDVERDGTKGPSKDTKGTKGNSKAKPWKEVERKVKQFQGAWTNGRPAREKGHRRNKTVEENNSTPCERSKVP